MLDNQYDQGQLEDFTGSNKDANTPFKQINTQESTAGNNFNFVSTDINNNPSNIFSRTQSSNTHNNLGSRFKITEKKLEADYIKRKSSMKVFREKLIEEKILNPTVKKEKSISELQMDRLKKLTQYDKANMSYEGKNLMESPPNDSFDYKGRDSIGGIGVGIEPWGNNKNTLGFKLHNVNEVLLKDDKEKK